VELPAVVVAVEVILPEEPRLNLVAVVAPVVVKEEEVQVLEQARREARLVKLDKTAVLMLVQ
tara:strand:- start:573 stop:758 length:186 start_codon:yes stop_codon:yes gene_type:complete